MSGEEIFECSLEDLEQRVLVASHEKPILVDFWADWCAPCHAITPHLNKVLGDMDGSIRLAKVEVDEGENMKLAGRYRLRGFPTIMLFRAGEELGRFSGARASHWIEDWIEQHLAPERI
jgi:putative thioredoxin